MLGGNGGIFLKDTGLGLKGLPFDKLGQFEHQN